MVVVKRRHELDSGCYWWFFIILFWSWTFEGIAPDMFDILGAIITLVGVGIIFYMPRKKDEESIWSK